jgi:hypothetical protein
MIEIVFWAEVFPKNKKAKTIERSVLEHIVVMCQYG